MTSALEQNIIKFIDENRLIIRNDKLLIALSGGADSVFALTFFIKFQRKFGIQICALHINHSLRGAESDSDENFCRSMCNELNIEFYSEKVEVSIIAKMEKLSIEKAARNIRYKKLNKYLEISKSDKIVTAHNLDDNTETVLLNLLRGTGLKGLSGIPIKRESIIRPFLSVSKSEIVNYLNNNKINFRIDSTNKENDFKRNYLRNEIIPKLKENINHRIDQNIFKLSKITKNSELIINELVKENISKFITFTNAGIKISKDIKIDAPYLFGETIKKIIEEKFAVSINYNDFVGIQNLIELQVGKKIDLSQNLQAISERDYLLIIQKIIPENELTEVNLNFNSEVNFGNKLIGCNKVELDEIKYSNITDHEFIDADDLVEPFVIRYWREGDKFNPLGLKGTKRISDFLTEQKVPSVERKTQPIVLSANKIIWVIGHRIDEGVKISKKTQKVIKLWVK